MTVGVTTGQHIAQGFDAICKGGTVVATGIGDLTEVGLPVSLAQGYEDMHAGKNIRGVVIYD